MQLWPDAPQPQQQSARVFGSNRLCAGRRFRHGHRWCRMLLYLQSAISFVFHRGNLRYHQF